ncbi:MAG: hypothetical protein VB130_07785 [Clostridium sp.]|nr:hypothetical protein [Clostridium sp.]
MNDIIIQYVLVVLLIVGLSYFVYLLKDKGINIKEDYFGITYTVLRTLSDVDATPKNVKKLLRAVSDSVKYVEVNFKNEDNDIKEQKALILARETVEELKFESRIDDESLIYIIRLCAAIMPATNKDKKKADL